MNVLDVGFDAEFDWPCRDRVRALLQRVEYKGWTARLQRAGDGVLLQLRFMAMDTVTGALEEQACRKWYISSHAVDSEVLQTVFKAVLTAEEHETRELFKYDGVPVFGPHVSIEGRLQQQQQIEVRA